MLSDFDTFNDCLDSYLLFSNCYPIFPFYKKVGQKVESKSFDSKDG